MPDLGDDEANADVDVGAAASWAGWEPSDGVHDPADTPGTGSTGEGVTEGGDREGKGQGKGKGKAGRVRYRPRVANPERVQ